MIFAAPLALLGLAILPPLFLLLRLTPPSARRVKFPPLALLQNLASVEQTPRHLPIFLLVLRLIAVTFLILGFAGPTLRPPPSLPGSGTVLLVIDDGWASTQAWPQLINTAQSLTSAAGIENRSIAILTTTHDDSNAPLRIQRVMSAAAAAQFLAAMVPRPWPPDRDAAAKLLGATPESTRLYLADGITDGPGFTRFINALRPTRSFIPSALAPLLGAPALGTDGALKLHASFPSHAVLRAESADGDVLATTKFDASGDAAITLPPMIANKIARFTLDGPATAGGTVLADSTTHENLAGLATATGDANTPFLGALYYLGRALPRGTRIMTGPVEKLLASKPSLLLLADTPLAPAEATTAESYIRDGGILVRFAGPITAATPDPLSADPLMPGDRRLGGALTWASPEVLAPFPEDSPFYGLQTDAKTTVSEQILADPLTLDTATVWATLHDGTPLIIGKAYGRGYLVNILTTANTDWSNFPLAGLFPAVLGRLAALGQGVPSDLNTPLTLSSVENAFGQLAPPAVHASIMPSQRIAAVISPEHPPGLYGNGAAGLALNLAPHVAPPVAAYLPNAIKFGKDPPPQRLGPALLAFAFLLLAADLIVSLVLRGALSRRRFAVLILLWLPATAHAQAAALQTKLGYILTQNATVDQVSAGGLSYLSADVSAHSSVQLGAPTGLTPGVDDLSFYPLLYWPLLAQAPPPSPAACSALASYISSGGLLVIDTQGGDAADGGSGAGFAPGATTAMTRATACLNLPPLEALTSSSVLAHSFYIIPDFPGRFTGARILIATPAGRDADGVTPIIIGQNDWAGAWAHGANGAPEESPLPGGESQRIIADRFGINLVIYALTGSYKSDQNSAPALLDRLGQ